jgi:hypothetical protein
MKILWRIVRTLLIGALVMSTGIFGILLIFAMEHKKEKRGLQRL